MKIKLGEAAVPSSRELRDRRLAIQRSWSKREKVERHRIALDSQARLDSLIDVGQMKARQSKDLFELCVSH